MLKDLEARGIVPPDVLASTDEAWAKAALRQLHVLAISPGDKRTKLQALNTLLAFTKSKLAERRAIKTTFEDWLSKRPSSYPQPPLTDIVRGAEGSSVRNDMPNP